MKHDELPLQVGDRVKYDNHGVGVDDASGVIVERLRGDYLRVYWTDLSVTTTHRCHSLRRDADIIGQQRH